MLRECEDLDTFSRPGESLLDAYYRLQVECRHEERDSRGQCFRCGDREVSREAV